MNKRLMAAAALVALPALVMAAPPQVPAQAQTDTNTAFGVPTPEAELAQYRGAQNATFNLQSTRGQVDNNRAINTVSGTNELSGQAFSNASGLSSVIQNSGNNVVIQNATIVNVTMQ